LLSHFFRVDLDDALRRDRIVLVQNHFLLAFVGGDDLEVIGAELIRVDFLDAVDELDGGGVAVLGEERDGGFTRGDGLENCAD